MFRILLLLCLFVMHNNAFAQQGGNFQLNAQSPDGFVYRISAEEARYLLDSNINQQDTSFFRHFIGAISEDAVAQLPEGHYLYVNVLHNRLSYSYIPVNPYNIYILDNSTDFLLQLRHKQSDKQLITARVSIAGKPVAYDGKVKAYRISRSNRDGLLSVNTGENTFYYSIRKARDNPAFKRIKQKIAYRSPLKYVVVPATVAATMSTALPFDAIQSIKYGYPQGTIDRIVTHSRKAGIHFKRRDKDRYYNRNDYYSTNAKTYTFFSKPKYKPRDTVKFKVLALKRNDKNWMKEPLTARLINEGKNIYISTARPEKRGDGYDFSFMLHDSMKLKLDRHYTIELINKDSLLVNRISFKLEEYELKKSVFRIEHKNREHIKGKPFELEFTAKDDNGLPMRDTKAEITVTARSANNVKPDALFIPLRLWHYETAIEDGSKKITIPDSIFPAAQVGYSIKAIMHNSEQERNEINISSDFYDEKFELVHTVTADTLTIEALQNSISQTKQANLTARDRYGYLLLDTLVMLPFKTKVNAHAREYNVHTAQGNIRISMENIHVAPTCSAIRNGDSIFIRISNPYRLPFSYQVYRRDREVLSGNDTALQMAMPANKRDLYYIALQWVWAGSVRSQMYQIPLAKKTVQLDVIQPKVVYPGQEVAISITATDYKKRPVKDMRILSYAFTNKFEHEATTILPDFSKKQKGKTEINRFSEASNFKSRKLSSLHFPFWNKQMKLDSIRSFRFLYPAGDIEPISILSEDSITQVAPFVTKDGTLQDVQYVMLNNTPVYFGFTDTKVPYSFEVDTLSRYRQLQIRTTEHLVTIDSFPWKPYHKTIFSVDINRPMNNVTVVSRPDSLNNRYGEGGNLSQHILSFDENNQMNERYLDFAFLEDAYLKRVMRVGRKNTRYRALHTFGPVVYRHQSFRSLGHFDIDFEFEPYFTYSFKPQLVKMVSRRYQELVPAKCIRNIPNLNDWVLTRKKIETEYHTKPVIDRSRISVTDNNNTKGNYTSLTLEIVNEDTSIARTPLLNIFLMRPGDFNFIHIYPGQTRNFYIPAGDYEVILAEEGDIYRKTGQLKVQEEGINFYRIRSADTLSSPKTKQLDSLLKGLYNTQYEEKKKQVSLIMNNIVGSTYAGPVAKVNGTILDENEDGIPGASVTIKGTRIGTISDIDGNFDLDIPLNIRHDAVLIIKAIGLESKEVYAEREMKIILESAIGSDLAEVLIYGQAVDRRSFTGSVSTVTAKDIARSPVTDIAAMLEGAAPGVVVTSGGGQPGAAESIVIRGRNSLDAGNAPLIVVNGQIYTGGLATLDPSLVETMEILKDASATAIYGSRGTNGVILINTRKDTLLPDNIKNALEEPPPPMTDDLMVSSLRSHFKDDAFWQPDLRTDKNGKASFTVKFPDDITAWKTFTYATDARKHTGQASGMIRSYKPVSASLHHPQFMVAGDTAQLIGKSVNYIPDTIPVVTSYFKNDTLAKEHPFALTKYHNDTLTLVADGGDSVILKYLLTKADGYYDGEEKSIPVILRGLSIARGAFLPLDMRDTSFTLPKWGAKDTLHISATTSLLDIVIEEIGIVRKYKHLCNEQLASKIIALLHQQRLYEAMKKDADIKDKELIQQMVDLLLQRQNTQKLWGWWQEGGTVYWISGHVINALAMATEMKYRTGQLNFEALVQPLVYHWERDSTYFDLHSLKLLHVAGLKIDYEKYIARTERHKNLSLGSRFALIRLRQQLGLPYNTDTLIARQQEDLFGNIYWKDSIDHVYDNELLTTLSALEIIQTDSTIPVSQTKIVNWLLQQRGIQGWRNIYESSRIITAIAKTIPLGDTAALRPVLTLSGGIREVIDKFPYQKSFPGGERVTLRKEGAYPVYFSYYQRYWDTGSSDLGRNFLLTSSFTAQGKELQELEAGKPVQLTVTVQVEKSAEFVMIEVPIPAGCSYHSKPQPRRGGEIHREYDKDRVNIFCEKLPKGTYTFTIELLPRYSGYYTLNPAKAELMYFPVFFGREKLKQIKVK